MKNDLDKMIKLAEKLNKNIHRMKLQIPIPSNFKITENNNNQNCIFIAKSDKDYIETYLEDKKLDNSESFDERLNKIISSTIAEMSKNNFLNPNENLKFKEEHNTSILKFKVYLQNNIKDNKLVKQVNAYFLEPEEQYVYQISIMTPTLDKNITKENDDKITNDITLLLKDILNNIKYKK